MSGRPEQNRGMATSIDTARPETAVPALAVNNAPAAAGSAPAGPPQGVALAAFRAGRSEADRTTDLLAFAIAAERGLPSTPDAVERARREADAALGEFSLRYVHNNVEQIRQEAVATHLGHLPRPPGFLRLVAANLVALAVAAGLGAWLWTRPDVLAALSGLVGN